MPCTVVLHGLKPVPFGPAIQPLGRVCMTTPHPYLHSSLPIATCSAGRSVGSLLVAFLPRFQRGVTSPTPRGGAVSHSPERRELVVGESHCIISLAWTHGYKRLPTFAAHPPCLTAWFRPNGSHTTACTRLPTAPDYQSDCARHNAFGWGWSCWPDSG